jgi:hypothetical protein
LKHFYSDAQKAATRILLNDYRSDRSTESIAVLGSAYKPLMVLIRIKRIEIGNDGGGGTITEYVAIDFDGMITRDAGRNMPFTNDNQRLTFFSELNPVNEP